MSRIQLLTVFARGHHGSLPWKRKTRFMKRSSTNHALSRTVTSGSEKEKIEAQTNNVEESAALLDEDGSKPASDKSTENVRMKVQAEDKRKYIKSNIFKILRKPEHVEKLSELKEMDNAESEEKLVGLDQLQKTSEKEEKSKEKMGLELGSIRLDLKRNIGAVKKTVTLFEEEINKPTMKYSDYISDVLLHTKDQPKSEGLHKLEAILNKQDHGPSVVQEKESLQIQEDKISDDDNEKISDVSLQAETKPQDEIKYDLQSKMRPPMVTDRPKPSDDLSERLTVAEHTTVPKKSKQKKEVADFRPPLVRPIPEILDSIKCSENMEECVQALNNISWSYKNTTSVDPEMLKAIEQSPKLAYILNKSIQSLKSNTMETYGLAKVFIAISVLPFVDTDSKTLVANEVKEKMSHFHLSKLLNFYATIESQSDLSWLPVKFVEDMKKALQFAWLDISNAEQLAKFLKIFTRPDPKFIPKLESKILDFIDDMSLRKIIEVLKFLERSGNRDMKILRYCAHNLQKPDIHVARISEIRDILYCFSRLNFMQENILKILSEKLVSGLKTDSFSYHATNVLKTLDSINHSFASLRYIDKRFISIVVNHLNSTNSQISQKQAASFLFAFAKSGIFSSHKSTMQKLVDVATKNSQMRDHSPVAWLRLVWSTCVLAIGSEELVSGVLDKYFVNQVVGGKNKTNHLMLRNIDSYAKHCIENYRGNRLTDQVEPLDQQHQETFEESSGVQLREFRSVIQRMAPDESYVEIGKRFPEGFTIDAVVCLDDFGKIQSPSVKGTRRVAIKYLTFHETLMPFGAPNGASYLMRNQLNKMGYQVLFVSHTAWLQKLTLLNRIDFLHQLFEKCVK